jgi:hypothetical protein
MGFTRDSAEKMENVATHAPQKKKNVTDLRNYFFQKQKIFRTL